MRRLIERIARAFQSEDGNATVEFVIVFPLFMALFGSAFEAGLYTARQSMLERATDIAIRDLRLGLDDTPTHDELKDRICEEAAIIPDCAVLHLELVTVSTSTWSLPAGDAQCIDRDEDITPVVSFSPGSQNELMLVRVCAVFEPVFPTTGLGLNLTKVNTSDYGIVATSAFVNEPS